MTSLACQWQPAAQSTLAAMAEHLSKLKQVPLPQGRTEAYVQKLSDLLDGLSEESFPVDLSVKLQPATRCGGPALGHAGPSHAGFWWLVSSDLWLACLHCRQAVEVASQGIARASGMALEALRPSVGRMQAGVLPWLEALPLIGLARQLERCAGYVLGLAETIPDILSSSRTAERIALAGTAVTGVSSLALTTMVHPMFSDNVESHVFRFDTLFRVLHLVHDKQPHAFAALRASTFSPAVILSCLTRILNWQRQAMNSGKVPCI